jgi:glycine/D-amino acid oxidase-like deaminating enzyme
MTASTTRRIAIVGGGIAGLSAAARLAQAGLPVILLEASQLGAAASTRNQGWLHSGGYYALQSLDYARVCIRALRETLKFCPQCVEPQIPLMAYLFSSSETQIDRWTQAWDAAGIEHRPLAIETIQAELKGIDPYRIRHAFELPDRAIRQDVLLTHLAAAAENAGAEIRTGTPVRNLRRAGDRIDALITATGEAIPAGLVILAGGTGGFSLGAEFHREHAGSQSGVELVPLKTHLLAVRPEIGRRPFCIPDVDGFNHLPHPPASVFGTGQWDRAHSPDDHDNDPRRVDSLRRRLQELFPDSGALPGDAQVWSGTMVQALKADQIELGGALWPAVIDHAHESPRIGNLVTIFPGRATLWSQLAEETRKLVLDKLQSHPQSVVPPPWTTDV